jgi:hypothetical protein
MRKSPVCKGWAKVVESGGRVRNGDEVSTGKKTIHVTMGYWSTIVLMVLASGSWRGCVNQAMSAGCLIIYVPTSKCEWVCKWAPVF